MWTETAAHYDLLIAENNDPVLDPPELAAYMDGWDGPEFMRMLGLTNSDSVLEIGIGTGRLALRTAPHCRHFTGIDLSAASLERAAAHLGHLPHVTLIQGDFLQTEIGNTFHCVYSSLTMLHVADKAAAAQRLAALTAPGGRIVLSLNKTLDTVLDFGTRQLAVYPDDPEAMAVLLETAGLRVVERVETEYAWLLKAMKQRSDMA